ncbi:MAG: ABC transporter ATP-binding protein [Chloroflexi bacterium]|nr:ABC transporter ATP-binding protein [Chloroflexota bacterium]
MASQLQPRLQSLTEVSGAEVQLRGLHKAFGARIVLRDLDLAVGTSEFVAVLGPSGGGKSTLLKILAGLEPPTDGQVQLVGAGGGGEPTVRIMFQEDRLLPWLSTLDNVAIGLPRDLRNSASELLVAVGLKGRERDWPTVLSGGQRQRAALARALAHRPDLLLLDEPFGALDALTRTTMQDLLLSLWQRERNTVLLVTHDVEEALVLADRVVLLIDGRLDDDFRVDLPRPCRRGDAHLAALKEQLLDRLHQAEPSR